MRRTSRILVVGFLLISGVLASSGTAAAANPGEAGTNTSTLLVGLALLLVAAACAMTAFKIYISVRGGKIALGWRWIVAGFSLLGLAQIVLFAGHTGLLALTTVWIDLTRVLGLVLVLFGATRIRRLHA